MATNEAPKGVVAPDPGTKKGGGIIPTIGGLMGAVLMIYYTTPTDDYSSPGQGLVSVKNNFVNGTVGAMLGMIVGHLVNAINRGIDSFAKRFD